MSHNVLKKKIPHVSEAKSDAGHKKAIGLLIEQYDGGHVKFSNWHQESLPDGGTRVTVDRHDTDPSAPAADHGLDLS